MREGKLLGVDVGGTKVAVGVADGEGRLLAARVLPTAASRGGEDVMARILGALEELASQVEGPVAGVGAGVPGVAAADGTRQLSPQLAGWNDGTFVRLVRERLGVTPAIANDVKAGLLGEMWRGALAGRRHGVFLSVGTGIAAGLLVDGRPVLGRGGAAGEVGYWRLGEGSPTLEEQASGPALARAAAALGLQGAEGLVRAAEEGDGRARRKVEEAAALLSRAVVNLVAALDPEVVVLGGGLGLALFAWVGARAREEVAEVLGVEVPVVSASLGSQAGLVGAVYLALRGDRAWEWGGA